MKRLTMIILGALIGELLMAAMATAEIPRLMSFQGRLCNAADSPVNGNYDFTFNIYDVATGGAALWTEVQNGIPVENGVYNILLGSATALNLAFDTSYWLGVAVAPDAEMIPRYRLTSAPYAFACDTASIASTLTSGGGIGQRYVLSGTFDTSLAGDYTVIWSTDTGTVVGTAHYKAITDTNISLADPPVIEVFYSNKGGDEVDTDSFYDLGYMEVTPTTWVTWTGTGYPNNWFAMQAPYVRYAANTIYLLYKTEYLWISPPQGTYAAYQTLNGGNYYIVIIR